MSKRRIAIVGSRNYTKLSHVREFVASLNAEANEIVTGGARGVDAEVEAAAAVATIPVVVFPADWAAFGKAAGPIRNQQIVDHCDVVVAFWDGKSPGTRDCIKRARLAGKPVTVRRADE